VHAARGEPLAARRLFEKAIHLVPAASPQRQLLEQRVKTLGG
jgi:hypothetical protein